MDISDSLGLQGKVSVKAGQLQHNGVCYADGAAYLCFVQTPEDHIAAGYYRQRVGLNHIAFCAESRAQVDQLTQWVKSRDFSVLYEEQHPHAGGAQHYALYCEDPNRIKVELVAPAIDA